MTPKQEERIRIKIARIRKGLADDKKHWGGFHHDGRGLRYLPPELFIKLRDYKGGLRYLRWFDKAFHDDSGFPIFLFEWTLILFKTGNLKEAEKKVFETHFSNNYLIDKFLGKERLIHIKKDDSNWEAPELTDQLKYDKSDLELAEFATWLETIQSSEKFIKFQIELLEIDTRLETEPIGRERNALINKRSKLMTDK